MPTPAENFEGKPVVIYGPVACGKTTYAKTIADHFGKDVIVDDWRKGQELLPNAVHLSCDPALRHTVCLTIKGKAPAYVFRFDEIIGQVQTSAQHKTADALPALLQQQAG